MGPLEVLGLTAAGWDAIGTWVTVAVAAVAAVAALWQLRQASQARVEEARAYVAIYTEPSRASAMILDLVVRNFGQTAAFDVVISSEPRLMRAQPREELWLPNEIPTLAPGQEWRSMWDFGPAYFESGLPHRYDVVVSFRTVDGERQTYHYTLDWEAYEGAEAVTVYSAHDIAKELKEIRKATRRWTEGMAGLNVFVRDGDSKDARDRHGAERRRVADAGRRNDGERASSDGGSLESGQPPSESDETEPTAR